MYVCMYLFFMYVCMFIDWVKSQSQSQSQSQSLNLNLNLASQSISISVIHRVSQGTWFRYLSSLSLSLSSPCLLFIYSIPTEKLYEATCTTPKNIIMQIQLEEEKVEELILK